MKDKRNVSAAEYEKALGIVRWAIVGSLIVVSTIGVQCLANIGGDR